MPDTFMSLADWLRAAAAPASAEMISPSSEGVEADPPAFRELEPDEDTIEETLDDALDRVCAQIRLFGAALAEACEREALAAVADAAIAVLGRELTLHPPEIASIVRDACARVPVGEILRVRVSRADAGHCFGDLAVSVDESLRSGDALVELRSGTIDARLGVRLQRLLDAFAS